MASEGYLEPITELTDKTRDMHRALMSLREELEAVFDAMISELEKNDIDTSELKVQKMQTMNINISGGKVSMGNVVQGAMNKIGSAVKGAKP